MTKRAGKKKSPSPAGTIGKAKANPDSQKPSEIATSPQAIEPSNSQFWPELSAENIAAVIASASTGGAGVASLANLKRISEMRVEMKAVKDRWPIPDSVRERMVMETVLMACNQKASQRDRMFATRLLLQMDAVNVRPKDLPDQVTGGPANQTINVTIGSVIQQLQRITGDADIDFRDEVIVEGSADDYAE